MKLSSMINNCNLCSACNSRDKPVIGDGDKNANLMFIGESPGYWEDRIGKPFVDEDIISEELALPLKKRNAGSLLKSIFDELGILREDVYITNVLKCRPKFNKTPDNDMIAACFPYLRFQIQKVNPKIIITLGVIATSLFSEKRLITIRGKIFNFNGYKIVPTWHPAFPLKQPNSYVELVEALRNDINLALQHSKL